MRNHAAFSETTVVMRGPTYENGVRSSTFSCRKIAMTQMLHRETAPLTTTKMDAGGGHTMKLIGILLSPFVRRVAVSLNILKLPFELQETFVFGEPDIVRRYNPLVRIPILVLDDGENLVESGAMLDEIEHMVSPERRLTPTGGPLRRRVVQTAAIALACAEKAQWAFYEGRVRPAEKIHNPWIEHNDKQVLGGFEHLAMAAANLDEGGWVAGTPNISQADVTTTVAYTFAKLARPNLQLEERFPQLSRFAERCETLPVFSKTPITPVHQLTSILSKPFVN
jgi:glutathione S-transferase